jgi:hypothetical protein
MKQTRQLLLSAALACALFSCGNNLSREEAAELIIKHYDFPNVDVMRLADGGPKSHLETTQFGSVRIGYSSDVFYNEGRTYDTHRVGLTEKGQSLLAPPQACEACFGNVPSHARSWFLPCVATNIWEFKEVSGISMSETEKTATVEYTIVAKGVNTFGGYKGRTEGMEEKRAVTMKHYDDGSWRIEDAQPPYIVKPDHIPAYAKAEN